jgi:hypothetical protein
MLIEAKDAATTIRWLTYFPYSSIYALYLWSLVDIQCSSIAVPTALYF